MAPVRKGAPGERKKGDEPEVETVIEGAPRRPVNKVSSDLPQVPAGVGRLISPIQVGAPVRASEDEGVAKEMNHSGASRRWFKEEHEVAEWFGGSGSGISGGSPTSPPTRSSRSDAMAHRNTTVDI